MLDANCRLTSSE
jgi:hypothetical protein